MNVRLRNFKCGLSLIELMITIVAVVILIIGISGILAAGHRNYNTMQERITRGVVPEAYELRSTFDRIVRKSSVRRADLFSGNNELYVYYYSNPRDLTQSDPDRYAHFYLSGTQLLLEQGTVTNFSAPTPTWSAPTSILKLSATYEDEEDVKVVPPATGIFSVDGAAVRMVLALDSETDSTEKLKKLKMTITSTAIRHNQ